MVSDYRTLNLLHADALSAEGYAVYTATTCTDVPQVFERFAVDELDGVVFASLVHGWHHREGEERPEGIPETSDDEWHTRNIREVVESIRGRQERAPRVLVAAELMRYDFYQVTAEALTAAGIEWHPYPAGDPHSIVDLLR